MGGDEWRSIEECEWKVEGWKDGEEYIENVCVVGER